MREKYPKKKKKKLYHPFSFNNKYSTGQLQNERDGDNRKRIP